MNANEANALTKENSNSKRGLRKAKQAIKEAASKGQFSTKLSVGDTAAVMSQLRDLGYGASQSEIDAENNIIYVSWASV